MKVSRYMTQKLVTTKPDDGARETFFRMREAGVRHAPVVDGNGALVGVISDRDLRRPTWVDEAPDLSHGYELDDSLSVGDLMSTNLLVTHTYESLRQATRVLLEHNVGALPVLDKHEALVGVLSSVDLLRALDDLLTETGR